MTGYEGQTLSVVDDQLASHPDFGDAHRISRRAAIRYRLVLEVLAERLPRVAAAKGALLDADDNLVAPVLRDPVVRMALEDAIRRLWRDDLHTPDQLEVVVELARDRLLADPDLPPSQSESVSLRAGDDGQIWLLNFSDRPPPLRQLLLQAMTDQFFDYNQVSGSLLPADAATVEQVNRACRLLSSLLPRVGDDVLTHITALGLVSGASNEGPQISAAGGDLVPRTVVVEPSELENPWHAAGILLHEALHLKAFDLSRCFALTTDPTATARVPWRTVDWEIPRVLFAFHVYAHMVVYEAAMASLGPAVTAEFGAPPEQARVGRGVDGSHATSKERARYLAEQLVGPLAQRLAPDGRRFVQWLVNVTAPLTGWQLERSPPPPTDLDLGVETPIGRYVRTHSLRVKHAPELECLFVFNPDDRALHYLNLNAWAVFDLCDGETDLEASYQDLVKSKLEPAEASRQLRLALARLVRNGLVTPAKKGGESG